MAKLTQLWKDNRIFLLALALMFCARSSLADWYHVPSSSMRPNIEIGDRVWVNKLAFQLQLPFSNLVLMDFDRPVAGDVIVFESAAADERMIKRVIGEPGDRVSLSQHGLKVNGRLVTDMQSGTERLGATPYTIALAPLRGLGNGFGEVRVPDEHYLVLGDNRANSADSRYYGFVPMTEIQGRATGVVASFDKHNYYLPRADRFFLPL